MVPTPYGHSILDHPGKGRQTSHWITRCTQTRSDSSAFCTDASCVCVTV